MVAIDFEKDIENRPASQQLLFSIKKYMSGNEFNPDEDISIETIKALFVPTN